MSDEDADIRALRAVSEEAQHESVELDWERLEERLLERVESAEAPRFEAPRVQSRMGTYLALGAVAAAAAVAVSFGFGFEDSQRTQPTVQSNGPQQLQAADLELGQVIEAKDQEIRVEHPGLASWTLTPYSSARLVDRGGFVTVELISGSVQADVVPPSERSHAQGEMRPERFAVEVAETRVAVRGTLFEVERRRDGAFVNLERGKVVVGPKGEPGKTRGWVMVAPATGLFALDGRGQATELEGDVQREVEAMLGLPEPNTNPQAASARDGSEAEPEREAPVAAPSARADEPPSEEDPEEASSEPAEGEEPVPAISAQAALSQAASAAKRCFTKHTQVEGVQVSATTTLTLHVDDAGQISSLAFNPPLAPPVQQCVWSSIQTLRIVEKGTAPSRKVTMGSLED